MNLIEPYKDKIFQITDGAKKRISASAYSQYKKAVQIIK